MAGRPGTVADRPQTPPRQVGSVARMPMDTQAALHLDGLTKTFSGKLAADHVSLTVPVGALTGLVGPNGAGKTTSLAMTVGLLRPDAGTATVHGVDVWADPSRAKALLGVLPDGLALPERLTGGELLTYWGLLRGMPANVVRARAGELMRVLELDEAEDRGVLVMEYSTGMRKKIGLATALLHAPKVLVLDEPFEAVDPVSARVLRGILRRFVAAGGVGGDLVARDVAGRGPLRPGGRHRGRPGAGGRHAGGGARVLDAGGHVRPARRRARDRAGGAVVVGQLIRLKFTIQRHTLSWKRLLGLVLGVAGALAT